MVIILSEVHIGGCKLRNHTGTHLITIVIWRKIWRIKNPAKILNLVWRSLANCLPTVVMLQQKGVEVDHICPVCRREPETIDHVFMHCPVAVQCWQKIIPSVQNQGVNLTQWWECILQNCDKNKRAEVASIC